MTDAFAQWCDADIAELVADYPFAWIVSASEPGSAMQMPLILERDAEGRPASLLGHLPRRHPVCSALQGDPSACFLFQGPHGYITPAWVADSSWAPTWNFATVKIEADVVLDDDLTDEALRNLSAHMERHRADPWSIEDMGERYQVLRPKVIGFRALVRRVEGRFKLGQDERPETFRSIVRGLGAGPLVTWMERFAARKNPGHQDVESN